MIILDLDLFKMAERSLLCAGKMSLVGLFLVGLLSLVTYVHANGEGWIDAHATFYGGGDASGTMGMYHECN